MNENGSNDIEWIDTEFSDRVPDGWVDPPPDPCTRVTTWETLRPKPGEHERVWED